MSLTSVQNEGYIFTSTKVKPNASSPEDSLHNPPGQPGHPQVVVDRLVALPRRIAEHCRHARSLPGGVRQVVGGLAADQRDRVTGSADRPPGERQRLNVISREQ